MKIRMIATAAAIAISASAGFGQSTAADPVKKIDELFAKSTIDTPGCAVGVAQKGKTVVERAYGAADLEHGVPNTPATVFESGSVAKQFTAAAVLLLEKDGNLKLSDDIRKYLPEMPDYGDKITIEMLLNHTNGLRDWGSVAAASGKPRGERTFSNAEVLDIASRQKSLNYKPGAEYSYTNTGYNVAAIIVERVSGKSFQEFTRERIFAPVGMTRSQWRDDFNRLVKNRAVAYGRGPSGYVQSMPFMNVYGNGGMLTTIGDFLIWNEALAQDKLGLSKALEHKSVLNDGREIAYARGLRVDTYKGFAQVSHSGSTGGYTSWLARYPAQGLSIAVLCNGPLPGEFRGPHQISDLFLPAAPDSSSASTSQAANAPSAGMFVNARTGFPVQVTPNNNLGGTIVSNGADRFTLETQDGNTFEHVRTAPVTLTANQLGEFAGTYASEETGATYLIAAEDGQLVLRISRWPDTAMKLRPSYKDAFLTNGALIRFRRNSGGRITEMSWGDGRMRDLRAPRVQERSDRG